MQVISDCNHICIIATVTIRFIGALLNIICIVTQSSFSKKEKSFLRRFLMQWVLYLFIIPGTYVSQKFFLGEDEKNSLKTEKCDLLSFNLVLKY